MHIVVNARVLANNNWEAFENFLKEMFRVLVLKHPEHRFSFIFPGSVEADFLDADNVAKIVLPAYLTNHFFWGSWLTLRLPRLLKKINADVFVSCDGVCPVHTSVPQCLIINDLGFLQYPAYYPRLVRRYLEKQTPQSIKKATGIVAISEFIQKEIIENYQTNPAKIDVINYAANGLHRSLTTGEKAIVKEKYTEGKEYFLVCGGIYTMQNISAALRAFSVFKRKQKNSWKLVIAGNNKTFLENLKTYKYRSDVVLVDGLGEEQLAKLIAASYAVVDVSFYQSLGTPALEAMQSGVVVIGLAQSATEEVAGDAALYANLNDAESIAEKMLLIYKDENLRSKLITNGMERSRFFSLEKSAERFWRSIVKMAES